MELDITEAYTTEVRPPKWIVEGIVPAGTVVLIAGDAGVGKTVLNLSEAHHVALGRPFLGFRTYQTRVLYFDQENSRPDLMEYMRQGWEGMGRPDPELIKPWLRVEHLTLGSPDWLSIASRIVQKYQPGIIYVDTAASALSTKDENDNAEASRTVQALRTLMGMSDLCPAIKVLKHAKFQSGGGHVDKPRRTIRGAKAWLGAVDQTIYHIKATAGRPRKDGLHTTILVRDKIRAFGLSQNIRIIPSFTETSPKGLILKGEVFESDRDLMVVEDN